jgi:hypothetical protein
MAKTRFVDGNDFTPQLANRLYGGGDAAAWSAGTVAELGQLIEDGNGNCWRCITSGLTGGSAPSWPGAPTVRQQVTDGGAVWEHYQGMLCDGRDADGSQPKVLLTGAAEVAGQLPLANLASLHALARNHIAGLEMAVNSGDGHDLDISPGAAIDSSNSLIMAKGTTVTKQIDAAWATGNAGGFPSAGTSGLTLTSGTWYHVFMIGRSSDGVVDFGFDSNLNAGVLLNSDNAGGTSGFDRYRRIGSVYYVDGTTKIRPFVQCGDRFHWKSGSILDVNGLTPSEAPSVSSYSLSVPADLKVTAHVSAQVTIGNNSGDGAWWLNLFDGVMETGNDGIRIYLDKFVTAAGDYFGPDYWSQADLVTEDGSMSAKIDTQSGVRTDVTVYVRTRGWTDLRGKNA